MNAPLRVPTRTRTLLIASLSFRRPPSTSDVSQTQGLSASARHGRATSERERSSASLNSLTERSSKSRPARTATIDRPTLGRLEQESQPHGHEDRDRHLRIGLILGP